MTPRSSSAGFLSGPLLAGTMRHPAIRFATAPTHRAAVRRRTSAVALAARFLERPSLRTVVYGGGAAIVGAALYFWVAALTGRELAITAVAVGHLVGRGVFGGSGRRGGRGYQLLAVSLTYLAIVSAYVPLAVRDLAHANGVALDSMLAAADSAHTRATRPGRDAGAFVVAQTGSTRGSSARISDGSIGSSVVTPTIELGAHDRRRLSRTTIALGILVLLGYAAAAPLLAGSANMVGLVMLAAAMLEAWRLTARRPVDPAVATRTRAAA